jgi:hypothetical protein
MATVNVRPDTAQFPQQETTFCTAKVWVSSFDTLPNGSAAFLMNKLLECDNSSFGRIDYYNNQKDGLYQFAYEGTLFLPPSIVALSAEVTYAGLRFNSVPDFLHFLEDATYPAILVPEELIILEPPRKVIHYPLHPGISWSYTVDPNAPFTISKKVVGFQKVTVPAGEFNTYVIQWLYDLDKDGRPDDELQVFDYVSTSGTVKRTVLARDLSTCSPSECIYFDVVEVVELTSLSLIQVD